VGERRVPSCLATRQPRLKSTKRLLVSRRPGPFRAKGSEGKKSKGKRERTPKPPKAPRERRPTNLGAVASSAPAVVITVVALGVATVIFVAPLETHKLNAALEKAIQGNREIAHFVAERGKRRTR
jgi:hypothetical protein